MKLRLLKTIVSTFALCVIVILKPSVLVSLLNTLFDMGSLLVVPLWPLGTLIGRGNASDLLGLIAICLVGISVPIMAVAYIRGNA